MTHADIEIHDARERHRFEATVDGQLAGFVDYEADGDRLVLPHTQVDPAFEGRGIGSALARHVLDQARAQGKDVVPVCPFIKGWIDRHPDYQSLVAPERPDGAEAPGESTAP